MPDDLGMDDEAIERRIRKYHGIPDPPVDPDAWLLARLYERNWTKPAILFWSAVGGLLAYLFWFNH